MKLLVSQKASCESEKTKKNEGQLLKRCKFYAKMGTDIFATAKAKRRTRLGKVSREKHEIIPFCAYNYCVLHQVKIS